MEGGRPRSESGQSLISLARYLLYLKQDEGQKSLFLRCTLGDIKLNQ